MNMARTLANLAAATAMCSMAVTPALSQQVVGQRVLHRGGKQHASHRHQQDDRVDGDRSRQRQRRRARGANRPHDHDRQRNADQRPSRVLFARTLGSLCALSALALVSSGLITLVGLQTMYQRRHAADMAQLNALPSILPAPHPGTIIVPIALVRSAQAACQT